MRRLLRALTALLLPGAGLVALLGSHHSLVTGLPPGLAAGALLFWLGVIWLTYRLALGRQKRSWYKALPSLLVLVSASYYRYAFEDVRRPYLGEPGFPHRYYSGHRHTTG